jgi:hypothetical protein
MKSSQIWTRILTTRRLKVKGIFCFPTIGVYRLLDGVTNPMYKLLHFLTNNIFLQREGDTSFLPG